MKLTLLTAAALGLSLATGAWANPGHHGEHGGDRHERHMDHMAERLDLSDSQRAQVEALMKQHHDRVKQSHEQMRTELRTILNDEQVAKMEQMHERMGKDKGKKKDKDHMKHKGHEGHEG